MKPGGARRLPLKDCQRRLLVQWGLGILPSFLILAGQTVLGGDLALQEHYGREPSEVWAWFIPLVMPTLLLIFGIVNAQAHQPEEPDKEIKEIDRFYYRLAATLSAAYLVIINAVVIGAPIVVESTTLPSAVGVNLLKNASLFLGSLQGVVDAALGTLLVKAVAK